MTNEVWRELQFIVVHIPSTTLLPLHHILHTVTTITSHNITLCVCVCVDGVGGWVCEMESYMICLAQILILLYIHKMVKVIKVISHSYIYSYKHIAQ